FAHGVDFAVDRVHVIHQIMNGAGNRVRHLIGNTIGIKTDFFGHAPALLIFSRAGFTHDTTGNTDHGSAFRHFFGDHGVGADTGVITHFNRAQHFGAS